MARPDLVTVMSGGVSSSLSLSESVTYSSFQKRPQDRDKARKTGTVLNFLVPCEEQNLM